MPPPNPIHDDPDPARAAESRVGRHPVEPEPQHLAALGVSAPQFWLLLERLPVGLLLIEGGRIVLANRTAERMLGRSSAEMRHSDLADLFPEGDVFAARLGAEAGPGDLPSFEWLCSRHGGGSVSCDVHVSRTALPERRLALLVSRDSSPSDAWCLEGGPSGGMDSLGLLTGGIAHDFNNLLTALRGHLDGIDGADDAKRSLANARLCAERAAGLSRRLMSLSRDERIEPQRVAADRLVRSMEPWLRGLLRPEIELEVLCDGESCPVLVDVAQVEQALTNLALNAQDAMAGGGKLTIRVSKQQLGSSCLESHPWARPGRYARIDVSDTGPGIPYEDQPRIFEPYFTSKAEGRGSGLGLSVVYGIVKHHRGFIHVESRPGAGTSFWLLLPAAGPAAAERGRAAAPPDTSAETTAAAKVLLVEDDRMIRDLARVALSSQGFDVSSACSAHEAEEIFSREPAGFGLLVTDLALPGKSGRDMANDLIARRASLRVIYTSGYHVGDLPLNLDPGPGVIVMQKPYSLVDLVSRVREALDRD